MSFGAPPPTGPGGQPQPPRQDIDFGVIGEAFTLIFNRWQDLVVPAGVLLLISLPGLALALAPYFFADTALGQLDDLTSLVAQFGLSIGQGVIAVLFYAGITRYTWNQITGVGAQTSDLWEGFRDPYGYLALAVIAGLIEMIGVIACCFGFLVAASLLMFAIPIKVVTGATATESISQSFSMLKKDWFLAGVFMFVIYSLQALSYFACVVGYALVVPLMNVAPTILYSRYAGFAKQTGFNPTNYPRG